MAAKTKRWVAEVKTDPTHPRGRAIYQESEHDCAEAGVEEGISQRAAIGNANAQLFHQSSGTGVERFAASEIGNCEVTLVETNSWLAIWGAGEAKIFSGGRRRS